jgi:putative ABC transport system permease protein
MVETLDRAIRENTLPIAYVAAIMAVAGLLALLLASVGVYAVMAYSVAERTHEIGIRMVVGAKPAQIVQLVLGRGAMLMFLGFACGLPCAFGLARLEASLFYGVRADDFSTLSLASVSLALVTLLACCIAVRRATRVDPMVALRYE